MKSVLSEAILSKSEILSIFKTAEYISQSKGRSIFGKEQKPVSARNMNHMWVSEYRSSNDSNDIRSLLKDNGFNNNKIKKIFSETGTDENGADVDDNVLELAANITKQGLRMHVVQWLNRNGNEIMKTLSESKILSEQTLSDKQIKQLLTRVAELPDPEPEPPKNEDVKEWGKYIKEHAKSKAERIYFVNKVIDALSNEVSIPTLIENANLNPESLNDGRVVTFETFRKCQKLLKECSLTWNDFLTRPYKVAGYIKFKPAVFMRQSLSENELGRKYKANMKINEILLAVDEDILSKNQLNKVMNMLVSKTDARAARIKNDILAKWRGGDKLISTLEPSFKELGLNIRDTLKEIAESESK